LTQLRSSLKSGVKANYIQSEYVLKPKNKSLRIGLGLGLGLPPKQIN